MLDPPKVQTLLKPPPILPCLLGSKPESLGTAIGHAAMDLKSCPGGKRNSVQRLVTLHPSLPLVAYLAEQQPTTPRKVLVVQDIRSREIRYSLLLADLAVIIYGETDVKKIPAAIQSLGSVQSLQFYDTATLHWSHMPNDSRKNWQGLLVQTSHRILLLNTDETVNRAIVPHKSQSSSRISWHMNESNLGALPSSNVIPLTPAWFLVGCHDGSLKCWDSRTQSTTKSIKGLGKGDWIVEIHAANSHHVRKSSSMHRILTVTKKGIAYLIEIQVDPARGSLDIQPPLARFVGGGNEEEREDEQPSSLLSYDAHRDWICWMAPATRKEPTRFFVWNLDALQAEFIQQNNKTLFQPQPHVVVTLPATEHSLSAASLVHAGWEQDTLILAVVTGVGEVHIMGATGDFKTPQQVKANPLLAVSLSELLQQDAGLDDAPLVRALGVKSHPMLPKCAVTTSLGILVLDMPSALLLGSRHLHFGAGLGSLGKSVLSIQHGHVVYGSLDVLQANPAGHLPVKNPTQLYECLLPVHLPQQVSKRPFGTQPLFLQSPSGNFVALVWPQEFRYEILHTASLLQSVGTRSGAALTNRSPVVDKGHGISSLAWVGDSDTYAVLYVPDVVQRRMSLIPQVVDEAQAESTLDQLQQVANLTNIMDIRSYSKNVVKLGAGLTKGAVSATMTVTNTATGALTTTAKAGMNATTAVTSKTLSVAKAATDKSLTVATGSAKKIAKVGNKGFKKATFGLFGKKKKLSQEEGGLGGMAADDEEEEISEAPTSITLERQEQMIAETSEALKAVEEEASSKKRHVELKSLVSVSAAAAELGTSVAAATSSSLGELPLRGGNRSPACVIFGGPVLCVASRSEGERDGFAHFYTRKSIEADDRASSYTTSGPTLPFPDLCMWDDDGSLCAIVVRSQVSIFTLDASNFSLLGSVHIGAVHEADGGITNVKFIHGVLFCCTWNQVYAVFLGDLSGGVCHLDVFLLASSDVNYQDEARASAPPTYIMALLQPTILGYQNGSLIVSTARGVLAIPLSHPFIRIGTLLPSGQVERAVKWFDAIPDSEHEILATFLERRGYPDLALDLQGLSLESVVDLCMRLGYIDRLEEIVDNYGVRGLNAVDRGRGVPHGILGPVADSGSLVVCVSAYLLAHGSDELVRRLATECLRLGDDGKKDALVLGTLLLTIDEADASRLIHRAVEQPSPDWHIGNYVRNYVLADRT